MRLGIQEKETHLGLSYFQVHLLKINNNKDVTLMTVNVG